jgi:flagellar biosynthesis component FlhA
MKEDWRTGFVQGVQVESDGSYRILKDWLGHEVTAAQIRDDAASRTDAAQALMLLTRDRYHALVRRPLAFALDAWAPVTQAKRLQIQAGPDLFPLQETHSGVDRLINSLLPELRERFGATTGLTLPGVSLFSVKGLGPGQYRLVLDGVLLDEGEFDGDVGDRYTLIAQHLEATIASALGRIVGYDQVRHLVRGWREQADRAQSRLADGVISTPEGRRRLVAIVRALASESLVPIELNVVFHVLSTAPPDLRVDACVEEVRRQLRSRLPSNDPGLPLATLSVAVEDRVALATDGGTRVLAASEIEISQLREAIAERIPEPPERGGILVLTPALRPFVRRLVALVDPSVPVVDRAELPVGRFPQDPKQASVRRVAT